MANMEVPVPKFNEVGLGEDFALLISQRQVKKDKLEALKAEVEEMNGRISVALAEKNVKCVSVDDVWRVTLVDTRSASKLSKEKLLEAGVPAETIVACTVEGKPYTTVQIKPLGGVLAG
jgi:hypothetical protein